MPLPAELSGFLNGLGGFFGANRGLGQARDDVSSLGQFQPTQFGGAGGTLGFFGNNANFQNNPQLQFLQNLLTQQGADAFTGEGMFSNPGLQTALQGNDLAGAFQGAQGNVDTGFLGQAGQSAIQGVQDLSGLQQQTFDRLTALARPEENQAANRLLNAQFQTGRLGTSGGADERAQQANRFLTAGDNRALQSLNFAQGQQNQQQQFGLGAIGQGFNQGLSQGQSRLQNAMSLFGLGQNTRQQGFSQGLQAQQGLLGGQNSAISAILGSLNAAANRTQSTGLHAQALGNIGQSSGGLLGGFLGGLF